MEQLVLVRHQLLEIGLLTLSPLISPRIPESWALKWSSFIVEVWIRRHCWPWRAGDLTLFSFGYWKSSFLGFLFSTAPLLSILRIRFFCGNMWPNSADFPDQDAAILSSLYSMAPCLEELPVTQTGDVTVGMEINALKSRNRDSTPNRRIRLCGRWRDEIRTFCEKLKVITIGWFSVRRDNPNRFCTKKSRNIPLFTGSEMKLWHFHHSWYAHLPFTLCSTLCKSILWHSIRE